MKQIRKRLFINPKMSPWERGKTIYLAVENGCNTLVFSFNDKFFNNTMKRYKKLIKTYALNIEAGGRDLPLLLPKKMFHTNRELFRMEQGERKKSPHFCPTNPSTIKTITENTHKWFDHILQKVTEPRVIHILPEEGHENTWCSCPACRAFSPAEQYLIAANTVADTLAKYDLDARLCYIDLDTEPDAEGISPRKNMIANSAIDNEVFLQVSD